MFILDFDMPFDNNMSKTYKVKIENISFFNSLEGIQNYLNIKIFILCYQKQSNDFYKLIKNIFDNEAVTI